MVARDKVVGLTPCLTRQHHSDVPPEIVSDVVSRDARKGQEKGNILDEAALRNAEASKAPKSQYLIDISAVFVLPTLWS